MAAENRTTKRKEGKTMRITINYITKFGAFNFFPFIRDMDTAKSLYLSLIWDGAKAVQIVEGADTIIWETKNPVFPKWETNPEIGF